MRALLCLPDEPCRHWGLLLDAPKVVPFPGWTNPAPPSSPHRWSAPAPALLPWTCSSWSMFSTGRPQIGCSSWFVVTKHQQEGDDPFPGSPGPAPVQVAREAVGLCCQDTQLAHVSLEAHHDLFHRAAPQAVRAHRASLQRVLPSRRGRTLCLLLLNSMRFLLFPSASLSERPPFLRYVSSSLHLGVVCKGKKCQRTWNLGTFSFLSLCRRYAWTSLESTWSLKYLQHWKDYTFPDHPFAVCIPTSILPRILQLRSDQLPGQGRKTPRCSAPQNPALQPCFRCALQHLLSHGWALEGTFSHRSLCAAMQTAPSHFCEGLWSSFSCYTRPRQLGWEKESCLGCLLESSTGFILESGSYGQIIESFGSEETLKIESSH